MLNQSTVQICQEAIKMCHKVVTSTDGFGTGAAIEEKLNSVASSNEEFNDLPDADQQLIWKMLDALAPHVDSMGNLYHAHDRVRAAASMTEVLNKSLAN